LKYLDPGLRDALAAEYALGTLQGRARRRFEHSLRDNPGLRREVAEWQDRLAPLDEAIEPVPPPRRVWSAIERRLQPQRRTGWPERLWWSVGWWRGATLASALLALALAVPLLSPRSDSMVVVMADRHEDPKITVSWRVQEPGSKRLRVRVIGHQTMAPGTAWELWMLPPGDQKPVSLGLITTHETQTLTLPRPLAQAVNDAWGLAMSVEPSGGSPTGVPSGPVLYKGQCARL
jgi:anti-sigma-K factor RskA